MIGNAASTSHEQQLCRSAEMSRIITSASCPTPSVVTECYMFKEVLLGVPAAFKMAPMFFITYTDTTAYTQVNHRQG